MKRLLTSGVSPDVTGIDGLTGLHQVVLSFDFICFLFEFLVCDSIYAELAIYLSAAEQTARRSRPHPTG